MENKMLRTVFNPELYGKRILLLIIITAMMISISCPKDPTEPQVENLKLMFNPVEQTVPINTEIDYIIAPHVTSPLRESCDFSNAIKQISIEDSDSLLSVTKIEDFFVWEQDEKKIPDSVNYNYLDRKPRQQIESRYLENGSFYIFKPQLLKDKKNRLGGKISLFKMDRYKMFQIDNYEDIELSSVIMKGYKLDKA